MPITLTAEEFNTFAKYTRPERLEAFLINHYKENKYTIEPEIIDSPSVTKQMTSKLFSASWPHNSDSMNAFLTKCSTDELLADLITHTEATGLCWGEPVAKENPRASVVSKVLSKVCVFRGGQSFYYTEIISKFVNAGIVTVDDVKLILQNQFATDIHCIGTKSILDLVKTKYPLAQLLKNWTIKDVQKLECSCKYSFEHKELHTQLEKIIESKQASGLAAAIRTLDTQADADPTDGYYSPDEDDVSATGAAAHHDDDA